VRSSEKRGLSLIFGQVTLTRALVALSLVLVAMNVASSIWDIRADHDRVELRAQRNFVNLTSLLAEQTAATLEGAGGQSPGAVERLESLYGRVDLGKEGFITLVATDGLVVTRVPDPRQSKGRRLPREQILNGVHRDGRYDGWAAGPFGNQVLVSASRVPGYPLIVVSGGTERAVMDPWRDEAWLIGLRTLLTSTAMLALIALAAWGLARRERALAHSWKRFQAMIEHSSDGVILSRGAEGGIFYVSPAFERISGYPLKEVRGWQAVDLVHPDYRAAAVHMRDEVKDSPGKTMMSEQLVRHKDGSWRWVENTTTNLLREPSVGALVMNYRDITERKLAEAERAGLEQRLRQAEKMEAVGRLAGGIAHDFNNILGGILGYAEMLVEGAPEGSALRRYAGNVLAAATRASHLVEQILSYSRSQRGKRAPVEIDRIVAETLELVRGSLSHDIRLQTNLPQAAALCVVGDPTQLHQIVMNLSANAIHAMGQHGTLAVTLDAEEADTDRELSHGTLRAGRYARLRVEDSGSGMDKATLARLFEPFFTTKEVGKGTGLGLALVYGIVTDSGGAIDVASTVGRGSRFTIYLPRVDAPLGAADDKEGPVAHGNGERVMIVEDEEALAALSTEVLKRLGYRTAVFADGAAALAAFDAAPGSFDAVITDEVMAGMTGTELAGLLRQRRPELPVILVSGYIGPMMTERAITAGIAQILKKPVQSRDLAAALARALHAARVSPVTP
jgi:PAS domain S-box-containing protein